MSRKTSYIPPHKRRPDTPFNPRPSTPYTQERIRTDKSQELHNCIVGYIRNEMDDEELLADQLRGIDHDDFVDASKNRYTHLLDAVRLPFVIYKSTHRNVARTKAERLLALILMHVDETAIVDTFAISPINGFTPYACIIGNLSLDSYSNFMSFLVRCLENGTLGKDRFRASVTTPNRNNYSPFLQAINNPDSRVISSYCSDIKRFYHEGIITREDVRKLVLTRTHNGITSLHCASSAKRRHFSAALRLINWSYDQGIITPQEYVNLLLSSNDLGYSPLHQICNFGSTETLLIYFKTLMWSYRDENLGQHLVRNKIEELLLQFTGNGYSIFHLMAMRQGQEFIERVVGFINEIFPGERSSYIFGELLNKTSSNGYLPSSNKLPQVNQYLAELRQRYPRVSSAPHAKCDSGVPREIGECGVEMQNDGDQAATLRQRKSYADYENQTVFGRNTVVRRTGGAAAADNNELNQTNTTASQKCGVVFF